MTIPFSDRNFARGRKYCKTCMVIAKLKLDISRSLEVWYTDHTAHYYQLPEQYLKIFIVNIIWLKPAIIHSRFIMLGFSGTISGLQIFAFIYPMVLKVGLNFYSETTAYDFERGIQRCGTGGTLFSALCFVKWNYF